RQARQPRKLRGRLRRRNGQIGIPERARGRPAGFTIFRDAHLSGKDEERGVPMDALAAVRKAWWKKKKAGWFVRTARFVGRSRNLTVFAGAVALLGGAREARRRAAGS